MKKSFLRMFLWYAVVLTALALWASAAGYFRLGRLWAALTHVQGSGLLWLAAVNGIILFTMTGRWWRILSACGHRITLGRLVGYRVAAGAVSYVTPGTQFGGEPLQAFLLVNRENVPADVAAAAVFLERAMELVLNLVLVGGGLLWLGLQPSLKRQQGFSTDLFGWRGMVWIVMAIAGAAAFFLMRKRFWNGGFRLPEGGRVSSLFQRLCRAVRRTRGRIVEIFRNHPGALVSALGLSLVNWGFVFAEFQILYGCVGEWLPAHQTFIVLVAARLGLWVPVPGGLGALEAGQLMAARLAGLPPEAAVGVCLLIRLRDAVVCSAGLFLTGRYLAQSIKGNGHGCVEKEI